MTVQMTTFHKHEQQGEPPPDTMAQRIHDQAQNLSVKLRRVGHGWSYLGALEYFELTIGELPKARRAGGCVGAAIRAEDGGGQERRMVSHSGSGVVEACPHCRRSSDVPQLASRRGAAERVVSEAAQVGEVVWRSSSTDGERHCRAR